MAEVFIGTFSVDFEPPVVSNRVPAPSAIDVVPTANISFDLTDEVAGVDLANTIVKVNGVIAWNGTLFINSFSGSTTVITEGYHFAFAKSGGLGSLTSVTVRIDSQDFASPPNLLVNFNWSFTTADVTAPVVQNQDPAASATSIPVDQAIAMDIVDPLGPGVDLTTVVIVIGGVTAFQSSVGQNGYIETVTTISGGYTISLAHPDLSFNTPYIVQVDASDVTVPPNVMTTVFYTFTTEIPSTVARSPYITAASPIPGTVNVPTNTDISFEIKTDLSPGIDFDTINVYLNGLQLVVDGVVPGPIAVDYAITITPVTLGWQVLINPTNDLEIQPYRIDANAYDTLVSPGPIYGEGYFEFSTDTESYAFEINAQTPLDCPYDTIPDPYMVTLPDVSSDLYVSGFSSPTAYWGAKGTVPYDILRVTTGTNTGDYIVRDTAETRVITFERPRSTTSGFRTSGFRRRKFSSSNPARATANSAITYPFMKLWGSTQMRYLAGYPSELNFPVPFTLQPIAIVYERTDGLDTGVLDDLSNHAPTDLRVSKQKYLAFSISSHSVSGGNYDRYALAFLTVSPVQAGARTLFQFSITSMDVDAEIYLGLVDNSSAPSSDGTNRSGVTLRRVVEGTSDQIHMKVYHGTASSTLVTTNINYLDFINKLWMGESEIISAGSTKVNLYDFEDDLATPVFSKTVIGGGSTDASNFSVTSIGNADATLGARVVGSLYYVDVEINPSVGGPYLPFALSGDVADVDAKWRPYANTLPVTFTPEAGLKTIQTQTSMLPFGTESPVVTEYHVLDTQRTLATINSLKPETLVEVLAVEDPSIEDPTSPNANIYRRAMFSYETLDQASGVLFMSKISGPSGNLLSLEIIHPDADTSFGVVVTGTHTAITLATDSGGDVLTTIQEIVDAIESDSTCPLDAAPAGIATNIAEKLERVTLFGGSEYKVSDNPGFNELSLSFRANKTGTYYVSMNDASTFGRFGGSVLSADGTFVTETPIFQPTDVGKTLHITNAANTTNIGVYTIVAVINGSSYKYPTSTVMLNRTDFIAETATLTWFLESRGYLLASGYYRRTNAPQTVALLTQDFNNLSDGTRTLSVTVCKNPLITNGALIECDSELTL